MIDTQNGRIHYLHISSEAKSELARWYFSKVTTADAASAWAGAYAYIKEGKKFPHELVVSREEKLALRNRCLR